MPRTIETTVYKFDELNEDAKEKARGWYRGADDGDVSFAESVYDMAADAADLFGLDLRQTRKTRGDGSHYYAPTVYFSGFSSQGDGACFEGIYKYKPGALAAVKKEFPTDTALHKIVADLQAAQKPHFYKLTASTTHRGHYYHSGCMSVDVEHTEDRYRDIGDSESDIRDALRSFADWIYSALEKEYEYDNSDECIDEAIRVNEYEFTENGERA